MSDWRAWEEIGYKAQKAVSASIPEEWRLSRSQLPADDGSDVTEFAVKSGLLSESEINITEAFATQIVDNVASRKWTAEDVTRAFCKRAAIVHQLTNCLTVIFFDEAIAHAKKLDQHLAKTEKTVGPLHGLPISLKDNFNIPGKTTSVGFCSWAVELATEESTIVTLLRDLGAVAYCKTNVPTAMMIAETVNNCYGRTTNPRNRFLTSGGSSGGESSLIAAKGSPIGVGTDIGGSLRIPAACTGIFTIRPSYGRFPHFDARSGLAGQEAVASVHGPMARSIADLRLWGKSVVGGEPWLRDPKCIELPWRDVKLKNKLKFAVLWNDGMVQPTPPVARALREVVSRLKAAGHTIVDWDTTGHEKAIDMIAKFFLADGGRSCGKILSPVHEPWRPEMKPYEEATEMGCHELWQIHQERTALQKMYLDRWASYDGLDAILSPTTPYATVKHGKFKHIGYTGIWNIMDYSAVSFPTGHTVDKAKDVYGDSFVPLGEMDEVTKSDYDAAAVHGMPVSLQLIGKRLQEEKILDVTERVCADIA
ncbi:amidase [Polychaeton citri CBS 116435]|uniref:amidase n=1 Tax=Polychaeton citri CBS 116435 TaxID=1314669 RepID=A0A9P4QAQ3_9PEZI|nr:amidase [Polychaeton citri CBS 116435]